MRQLWRGSSYVENGTKQYDTQGVEVANYIVGDTVALEHVAEEIGGATDTVVVPILHGEEAEHASSLHRALDILHEQIIVVCFGLESLGGNCRRLGRLPPPTLADSEDTAVGHAVCENTEDVWQVRAAGLTQDNTWAEPEKKGWQGEVENEGNQICQPPANQARRVARSDGGEGADVDEQVEPQHGSLNGVLGVHDYTLATLKDLDYWHGISDLVEEKRGHIGLEHRCTHTMSAH